MLPKIAPTALGCGLVAALLLAPVPVAEGQQGRWRVLIEEGAAQVTGDLRLTAAGGRLRGTLLLETSDTAPVAIADGTTDGDRFEFRIAAPTWRFVGRVRDDHLHGEVLGGQPRPRRWTGWPLEDSAEFYAALPRFKLRQIHAGPSLPETVLPAPWVAAAGRAGESPERLLETYRALTGRAGLTPLDRQGLGTLGLTRAMGLYRRGELRRVALAALAQIRENLPSDDARGRFDRLFRSRDGWMMDVHDVALSRARFASAGITWDSARPALARAGLLPEAPEGVEAVPLTLYRLATLAESDSAGFVATVGGLGEGPAASAARAILSGYTEASAWYEASLLFLLEERWMPAPGGEATRSPVEAVAAMWGEPDLTPPRIRAHRFGYPEGAPRPGVPAESVPTLVQPLNWSARAWLGRHGPLQLLRVLRHIDPGFGDQTTVEMGGGWRRVTSVGRRAAASFNGFLEPEDEIWVDPSYLPLWALGSVVHEWQHVLQEGRRLRTGDALKQEGETVTLVPADPHLAEGLAEWGTDLVLLDAVARWPMLGVGEAEKRATLSLTGPNDPHVLGLFLVRTLAGVRDAPGAVVDLLVRHGASAPAAFAAAGLARIWAAEPGAADLRIPVRGERVLVPETVFTVEDAVPDLVYVRIRATPRAEDR